jgi:hypothetical protein
MTHDDELIIPNHPHVDQRNWQPGDDDDRPGGGARREITEGSAVRTLRRLLSLTGVPPEELADALFPSPERLQEMIREMGLTYEVDRARIRPLVSISQIVEAKQYLEKLAACFIKKMEMQQCKCAECGNDIWRKIKIKDRELVCEVKRVRRGARYCSAKCRQKAFRKRKRVTDRVSDTTAKPSPCDGYIDAESSLTVTHTCAPIGLGIAALTPPGEKPSTHQAASPVKRSEARPHPACPEM